MIDFLDFKRKNVELRAMLNKKH